MADRNHFEPAVVLQVFDLRAQRVEMRNDRARTAFPLAGADRPDRAAPCQFDAQSEPFELRRDMADDRIRVARRTRDLQQGVQRGQQVFVINGQT